VRPDKDMGGSEFTLRVHVHFMLLCTPSKFQPIELHEECKAALEWS